MQETRQIKQIIGQNIRARRDELGFSRAKVAQEMGIEPILIYKWERGQHRPADHNLTAIAGILGREVVWFYTDHNNGKRAVA